MPFLRDMEVTTHPHVLVRGIRKVGLAGGRDACCPGRQRSNTYTHTHKDSQPHRLTTPLLKVSVGRQRRDPYAHRGTGERPTQKAGDLHLRGWWGLH